MAQTRPDFADLLREHRLRRGLSQHGLAAQMGTDASMVLRVERRERFPRDRGWVEAAAVALALSVDEADELLVAAGHVPAAVFQLGASRDPLLVAVARTLTDPAISQADRDRYRAVLVDVTAWFGNQVAAGDRVTQP
jgi:transcriptional regulator with XRE-family HTH domain